MPYLNIICKKLDIRPLFLAIWFKNSVSAKLPRRPAKRVAPPPVGFHHCPVAELIERYQNVLCYNVVVELLHAVGH